jgi:hypothetical protein
MACRGDFLNPKGIASLSPGLARFRESLPWVTAIHPTNPERVEAQCLTQLVQPLMSLLRRYEILVLLDNVDAGSVRCAGAEPEGLAKLA